MPTQVAPPGAPPAPVHPPRASSRRPGGPGRWRGVGQGAPPPRG
jgi:hypothetical protein